MFHGFAAPLHTLRTFMSTHVLELSYGSVPQFFSFLSFAVGLEAIASSLENEKEDETTTMLLKEPFSGGFGMCAGGEISGCL